MTGPPDSPLRVLFVSHAYPDYPGAFRGHLVQRMAWGLRVHGVDVDVVCPRVFKKSPLEEVDERGVRIHRFAYPSGEKTLLSFDRIPLFRMGLFYLSALIRVWRLMCSHRYDLIHAHWIVPLGPVAVLAGKFFGLPVISQAHGSDVHTYGFKNRLTQGLACFTVRNSLAVLVVSRDLGAVLNRSCMISGSRTVFFPPFIDTERFSPPSDVVPHNEESWYKSQKRLIFAGGLFENKGIFSLLEAAGLLLPLRPELHLTFLGDGPLKGHIEKWAAEQRLEKRITLAGNVPYETMPRHLKEAFALLLPSLQEGTPSVLLEALSCGIPVLASGVGGITDIVRHEHNGLIIRPGSAEDITRAVIRLLDEGPLYERLKQNARPSALPYGVEAGTERLVSLYSRLMRFQEPADSNCVKIKQWT
jgi:teichuronic acid biosynthesis glycosyltransferase TuaC